MAAAVAVLTASLTACSNDLPTDAAENPRAGPVQADVIVAAVPVNDDFDNATAITALPFTESFSTVDATGDPDDTGDCGIGGHTVWYQFTPTADIRININTVGSDYDTGIAVYTGTRDALNFITCNDDAFGVQSSVSFDAAAGETYRIMVGGFGDASGNLVLKVDVALQLVLTVESFGSVNPATGVATVRGTVTCSTQENVSLEGGVTQQIGRLRTQGSFFTSVECDGVTPWEAQVFPENGPFAGGRAAISAFASFRDEAAGQFAADEVNATVRLRGKGR